MAKTDEEKQQDLDARNKRRRDANAKAKEEALMTDVATLSPGDTFTLDEVGYVVLSIDRPSGHIHTHLLEGQENPDIHGSVGFGTMVDIIAKGRKQKGAKKDEAAVVSAPAPANPAVTGGTWFK